MRKTIGGSSAKLGKKSQDAYLLVFKKVKSPILADSQDFEHILALPDSLSAFIDLQIALSDVETDEVPLDDGELEIWYRSKKLSEKELRRVYRVIEAALDDWDEEDAAGK